MEIDDLQKLWSRLRREPRRVLPWLFLAIILGIGASLLNEGIRRIVFPSESPPVPMVLDARFAQVLRERTDLARSLGTTLADPVSCGATVQPFEKGFMIWTTEEPDSLLACFSDVQRSCQHYTHVTLSLAERNLFESLPKDVQSLFNPTGGFRTTWVHNRLGTKLGLPLVREKSLQVVIQRFEGGLLIKDVPWFRRSDNQFLALPEVQPVLSILFKGATASSWSYYGKYGA